MTPFFIDCENPAGSVYVVKQEVEKSTIINNLKLRGEGRRKEGASK